MIRTNGVGGSSFMPDGAVAFSSGDIHNNLFLFDDLFELPAHLKSTSGLEGGRVRWSDGWRAIDPSISPQLQEIIYRALEREPTNRYKTADEFAWDLAHPEQVGVAERVEELTNWKQRRDPWARRAAFYVAMALIPIVVLGLLFFVAKHV